MASFSKASQGVLRALRPWLGIPESHIGHAESDSDEDDASIWRRPSTATTLVGSEASAGSNGKTLEQNRSATSPDYKGWPRSLRSLAAHFYAEENTRPSGLSNDSLPRTPEKRFRHSPRKPLPWSKSSIPSRGDNAGKFSSKIPSVFDDHDPHPKMIAPTPAPLLTVDIPKCNLAVNTDDQSMLADERIMQAYRGNPNKVSDQLNLRSESHSASLLPRQESERVVGRIGWKFPVAGNPNDAYHELLQGPRGSSETNISAKASSSNDSDVEDNDEDEEYDGTGLLELPIAAKSKISLALDSHREGSSSVHANGNSIDRTVPLSAYLKTPSSSWKGRRILHRPLSIRKSLDRLQHTLTGSFKSRPSLRGRAPSYAYDADVENSEPSPPCPSMGSRHEWQERRIDRNRRYAEAVADRPPTEDDSESGEDLQLSRSPTRKPLERHQKGSSSSSIPGVENNWGVQGYHPEDLRFSVEANERRNADELSLKNLRYAIEAIDRPSAAELGSGDWRSSAEPHMIPLPDSQDPYEAALMAAGLHPERRQSWIPTLESLYEQNNAAVDRTSVPAQLDGVCKCEGPHDGGAWAPKQGHEEHDNESKVFKSFEYSSDAGSESEGGGVSVGTVGYRGQAGMWSIDFSRGEKIEEETQLGNESFVDTGASAYESDGVSSRDDTISID